MRRWVAAAVPLARHPQPPLSRVRRTFSGMVQESCAPSVCLSTMAVTTPGRPCSGVAAPLVLGTWNTVTGAFTFTFCPGWMSPDPEEAPEARVGQRSGRDSEVRVAAVQRMVPAGGRRSRRERRAARRRPAGACGPRWFWRRGEKSATESSMPMDTVLRLADGSL